VVDLQQALMEKAEELAEKIEKEFPARKFIDDSEIKSWARGMTEKVAERVRKLNAKAYQLDKAIQPLKIFFNTHSTPEELSRRWLISKYPDKSPVIVMPSIKLSKGFYEENVKKVGTLVDEILNLHPNERGIIHCVEGSMLINTSDGLKMISDVKVGDKVQSWNEIELKFENKQVTHTYDNGERECIELMLSDGRTLICTPDHKILTDRGYVEAKDLTEEDEIIDEFAEDRRVR
jgi:hypothetical protein